MQTGKFTLPERKGAALQLSEIFKKTLVSSALSVSFRFLDLRVKMAEIQQLYMIRWSMQLTVRQLTVCPAHKDYVESNEIIGDKLWTTAYLCRLSFRHCLWN